MYILYTDESRNFVDLTLREINKKVTVINLKHIDLADFGD